MSSLEPVLILLPPSETKSDGGSGAPLDLDRLSLPTLTPLRRKLADALVVRMPAILDGALSIP